MFAGENSLVSRRSRECIHERIRVCKVFSFILEKTSLSFAHVTRTLLLLRAPPPCSPFSRKSLWAGRECVCVDAVQE